MTYEDLEMHLASSVEHCEETGRASREGHACQLELYTQEEPPDFEEVWFVRCSWCGIQDCVQHEFDEPAKREGER